MSHNKMFKVVIELSESRIIKGINQRYKLLKTKPKDINDTAPSQNIPDFVYSTSN